MTTNLVATSVAAPGFFGLNSEKSKGVIEPGWATTLVNAVFDDSGRISSRQGYAQSSITGISETVRAITRYSNNAGVNELVMVSDGSGTIKFWKSTGGAATEISGTVGYTDANVKFQSFNGDLYGLRYGQSIIKYTGTGTFANLSTSGTEQPTSGTTDILAAFGRLWALDLDASGQGTTQLRYSDVLDASAWNGGFDLGTVWRNGYDKGVALAEFNGYLIVFGENSILVWNNPWNPDGTYTDIPNQMTLVETIQGVGCVARDTIVDIGTDLLFLSKKGVVSLGRIIQEKSMPINNLSKNVVSAIVDDISSSNAVKYRACYSPTYKMYVLAMDGSNVSYYFDLRSQLQDGTYRVSKWTMVPTAMYEDDGILYLGMPGGVYIYSGYLDELSSYDFQFAGIWNDFGDSSRIKIPKEFRFQVEGGNGTSIDTYWSYDYDELTEYSYSKTLSTTASAQYGIAVYNSTDRYGARLVLENVKVHAKGSGYVVRFKVEATVNGTVFSLQQISMQAKVGRLV